MATKEMSNFFFFGTVVAIVAIVAIVRQKSPFAHWR